MGDDSSATGIPDVHEETDKLQFRDPGQPDLHLVYWTRSGPFSKPNANLLFWIHGIGEHSGRHRALASRLLHNVPTLDAVLSFDFRGHGLSGGERGSSSGVAQFTNEAGAVVLPHMSLRYGEMPNVVVGGHSMGGLVAANVCAQRDKLEEEAFGKVCAVVLSGPALKIFVPGVANKVLSAIAPVAARLPGVRGLRKGDDLDVTLLSRDAEVVEQYREDKLVHDRMSLGVGADFLTTGARIMGEMEEEGHEDWVLCRKPLLILHGGGDRICDIAGSRRMVEVVRNVRRKSGEGREEDVRLVEIGEAYHEVYNEREEEGRQEFFAELEAFLNKALNS